MVTPDEDESLRQSMQLKTKVALILPVFALVLFLTAYLFTFDNPIETPLLLALEVLLLVIFLPCFGDG
jgi:hypothetical protein